MKFKTFFSFSMLDRKEKPYISTSAEIEYHGEPRSEVESSAVLQLVLNRAAMMGDCATLEFIRNNGGQDLPNLIISEALNLAINNGKEDEAVLLIQWDINGFIDSADPETRETFLHKAALKGQSRTCAALISKNPKLKIDAKNRNKSTALHCAVASGDLDTVKVLLNAGASIKIKNEHNNTAISLARLHNQNEILECLEKNVSSKNIENFVSSDPLAPQSSPRISRIS